MRAPRLWRIFAIMLALTLVAAACGDDDDTSAGGDTTTTTAADNGGTGGTGGEINLDEPVEVATGTTLDLPNCPSDWDPMQGITDTSVKLAMSLPESGPVAALGGLDNGMQAWFDHIGDVDGRKIEVVSADDAYDPARTLSNTQNFIETDKPAALVYMIGTPSNFAIRDLTQEECMPQLFNSTGHPAWGDPANYPWTIGGLLSYKTEAQLWCSYISDNLGSDATVAALYMDNDFGLAYEQAVQGCADAGTINLVKTVRHDPAAADVTDEITTLASSDADVVLLGTTGAPCPQAMAAIASSSWKPVTIMSNTCQGIATYFKPIDPAGEGVIVASTAKEAGETDDPAVAEARQALEEAGLNPDEGAYYTGVIFGQTIEQWLKEADAMEGGLNRVNMMRAVWNADWTVPTGLDGATNKSDGTNDAYLVEAARFGQYHAPAAGEELGKYEFITDLIDMEGQTGSYQGG